MNKDKRYICVADLQGGDFCVGVADSIGGWRERAIYWTYCDGYEELQKALETKVITDEELVDFIQDFWDIEIVDYPDKGVE